MNGDGESEILVGAYYDKRDGKHAGAALLFSGRTHRVLYRFYPGYEQGIFGRTVACPLHNWNIALETGVAVAPDEGCAASFPVRLEGEKVFLSLTPNEGCPEN